MFELHELYLIHKLLSQIKYSDFDAYEANEFANSPITNQLLEKIEIQLREERPQTQNPAARKFCFEFENPIGQAIKERLVHMSDSVFQVIAKWNKSEAEAYARDILGPIDFEKSELDKLTQYLIELAHEKTSS